MKLLMIISWEYLVRTRAAHIGKMKAGTERPVGKVKLEDQVDISFKSWESHLLDEIETYAEHNSHVARWLGCNVTSPIV